MQYCNIHCLRFPNLEPLNSAFREAAFAFPNSPRCPVKTLKEYYIQILMPCSNSQSKNLNHHQRESSQFHRQQEHPFSWFMHQHSEHDSCHGTPGHGLQE